MFFQSMIKTMWQRYLFRRWWREQSFMGLDRSRIICYSSW